MSIPVSLLACDVYELKKVRATLATSIQNLGGLDKYIRPGERVLLKVNLLAKKKPEEAVTTHPVFVQALASLLIEYGAKVVIGDSPGGLFTAGMLSGVYKTTGMETAAAESGATLNANFNTFEKENPRGVIMKRLSLTDMLNDVDKVITVAKLKTHGMMTYTGAVKNMFGVVPGTAKAEYHLNIPDYDAFADALIDICLCAAPVLSFIDGIVGMEGDGPSAGTPIATNVVLASPSPYHIDMAACRVIGLNAGDVPVLRRIIARGMAAEDLSDIQFTGEKPDFFAKRKYTLPATHGAMNLANNKMPGFVRKFIARHIQTRPVFDAGLCSGCGVCRDNCPAKIVAVKDGKASAEYQACIRCYCCQELCPRKAVGIYRPRLSRLMRL